MIEVYIKHLYGPCILFFFIVLQCRGKKEKRKKEGEKKLSSKFIFLGGQLH